MDYKADINEAVKELRDAKALVYEATSKLQHIAYKCSKITMAEAFALGLVRFNFPTPPHFKEAMLETLKNS